MLKERNWQDTYDHLMNVIAAEFSRHQNQVIETLSPDDRDRYNTIAERKGSKADYETSLLFLTKILHEHYQKRVILLLDEYDAPIHAAFLNGYYAQIIDALYEITRLGLKR